MRVFSANCYGHTLVELLVAMTLSILLFAAIIPINNIGLKATQHQDNLIQIINQLRQSVKQFETDVKSTALTGCLLDKTKIRDLIFKQPVTATNQFTHPWLQGKRNETWSPSAPSFDNTTISQDSDAINLVYAAVPTQLNANSLNSHPQRIFYITNCSIAEITRGFNSTLATDSNSRIYPLQSVIYYVREINGELVLYRQYLSKTGNPRNEPLIDNLEYLKIGYGEQIDSDTLMFKAANNITKWTMVKAVYINIKIKISSESVAISSIIQMPSFDE